MDKALISLFTAIRSNVDNDGNIKLQFIADELEELGYFNFKLPSFNLPNIANVTSKDEATQLAVDFQDWASEQSLSYLELAEYSGYFADLATKFNLTEEFRENGII